VAVIFDIIYVVTSNGRWAGISFWLIAAGVIGGLLSAVFGLMDWLAIPDGTRAKKISLLHGLINIVAVVLFLVSWLRRRDTVTSSPLMPIVIGIVAIVLAFIAAWLGGELVYRMSVGVDAGTHVDSPSSLSGRPSNRKGDRRGANIAGSAGLRLYYPDEASKGR